MQAPLQAASDPRKRVVGSFRTYPGDLSSLRGQSVAGAAGVRDPSGQTLTDVSSLNSVAPWGATLFSLCIALHGFAAGGSMRRAGARPGRFEEAHPPMLGWTAPRHLVPRSGCQHPNLKDRPHEP